MIKIVASNIKKKIIFDKKDKEITKQKIKHLKLKVVEREKEESN